MTLLLLLPVAHQDGAGTSYRQALFTADSGVCVTGPVVVDTPTAESFYRSGLVVVPLIERLANGQFGQALESLVFVGRDG